MFLFLMLAIGSNTPKLHQLTEYSNDNVETPASTHGSDNGALHVLMMNYLAPEKLHSSGYT